MNGTSLATRRKHTRQRRHTIQFLLYCLPALVFFGVFKYWPMIYSSILSFANWNFIGELKWVGFKNYASMFSKTMFVSGIGNTFKYILALQPFFLVLPLLLSVLLLSVKNSKRQNFLKAFYFMPTILAFSIVCIVWMWMFNPSHGVLNNVLRVFGSDGYNWLTDKNTAFFSIVLVCGWKYMGQNLILFMAGLMNISNDCIEASLIDGASGWQCFWHIKFPLLAPTSIYLLLTSVIFAAERAFTAINLLTQGGPNYSTNNLSYVIYEFAFKYFNIGMASAIAVVTSVIFLVITVTLRRMSGGFNYDET